MPNINVEVKNKIAVGDGTVIICGNSDYTAVFNFDAEWDEYETKTARFISNGGKYTDVVFTGNSCAVPVQQDTRGVQVGVFAGDLHTTTPAYFDCAKSILCGSGIEAKGTLLGSNEIIETMNKTNKEQIRSVTQIVDDGYKCVLSAIENMFGKKETVLCTVSAADLFTTEDAPSDSYIFEKEFNEAIKISSDTVIVGRITNGNVTHEEIGSLVNVSFNGFQFQSFYFTVGYKWDSDTQKYIQCEGIFGTAYEKFDSLEIIKIDYKKIPIEYIETSDIEKTIYSIANEVGSL